MKKILFIVFILFFSKIYGSDNQPLIYYFSSFNLREKDADNYIHIDSINKMINAINQAEHNIYVKPYLLDNPIILNALKRAHKRGIDVHIMLENVGYNDYLIGIN